ncbi:LacI family DNA-binding transcriptional regulator [Actinoplanes sp. CA-131856]
MPAKLTIEDVARAAGVSRATVSRVMNDVPGATEAVRHRVRGAASRRSTAPCSSRVGSTGGPVTCERPASSVSRI